MRKLFPQFEYLHFNAVVQVFKLFLLTFLGSLRHPRMNKGQLVWGFDFPGTAACISHYLCLFSC